MESLGTFPDPFWTEIGGQPEALLRAAAALEDQRAGLEDLRRAVRTSTPPVFTGMGASYAACYPAVSSLGGAGMTAVQAGASELLHFRLPTLTRNTVLVAVSQSGASAEVVKLARALRRVTQPPFLVSVTNGTRNRLAPLADVALDTRAGAEKGPATMSFAASLVMLRAVGAILGGAGVDDACRSTARAAERTAGRVGQVLGGLSGGALARWLGRRETLVVLGRGPSRAAAEVSALVIKESARVAVESFDTAQFRHGPMELAGRDMAAIVLATEPRTRALDLALIDDLRSTGAKVLTVARRLPSGTTNDVAIGSVDDSLAPAVSALPAQVLAWELARRRGRRPDALQVASKVTVDE